MPRSSSRSSSTSRSSNTRSSSRAPASSAAPRQTAPPQNRQQIAPQPQQRTGGLGSALMSGFAGGMAFGAGSQLVRGLFGGSGSHGDHGNNQNDQSGSGYSNPNQSQGFSFLSLVPLAAGGLGTYLYHKMNKGKIAARSNRNMFLMKCGGAFIGSYLLSSIVCSAISSNRNEVMYQDQNNYGYQQDYNNMNTNANANFNQGFSNDYNSNTNFGQDKKF